LKKASIDFGTIHSNEVISVLNSFYTKTNPTKSKSPITKHSPPLEGCPAGRGGFYFRKEKIREFAVFINNKKRENS